MTEYKSCTLCARACGINRYEVVGYCRSDADMRVCRIAPHRWEEPIISGERGSGTVFFSGCSLRCVFCQNESISCGGIGEKRESEGLASHAFRLKNRVLIISI